MGKRYYCDYCDRSFQDNMHNRKKHLNGVQHHRAKKAWFDNFRDAATILYDEQTKEPCRKFIQTGQCVFGSNCRFSHMTERDVGTLRQQIEDERHHQEDPQQEGGCPARSTEEWLARREKRRAALNRGSVLEEEEDEHSPGDDLPLHLLAIPDLPLSLLPPPPGGWKDTPQNEWG